MKTLTLRRSCPSFLLLPLLACTLLACGEAPEARQEPLGVSDDAIFGGTPAAGDEAVVAVTWNGITGCSGTLVAPDVVVTAAHCIHPDKVPFEYEDLLVFFGSAVGGPGESVAVAEGATHPQFVTTDPNNLFDVGMLRLAQPAGVTPKPMVTGELDEGFIGAEIRMVGFGVASSSGGGAGVKRQTMVTVTELGDNQLTFFNDGQGTCSGDSGGPAFWTTSGVEVFVGIHSLSDCETYGLDERIDIHRDDFIADFIEGRPPAPSCEGDGACATGCAAADPDCPCASDGFCTAACADPTSDPDCDPACVDCDPTCGADGVCDDACETDPDCDPCPEGGCGGGPSTDDSADAEPASGDDGGCRVPAGPSGRTGGSVLTLVASALVVCWRRGRRSRSRRGW